MNSLYSKSLNSFIYSFSRYLLRTSYALHPKLSTAKSIKTLNPRPGHSRSLHTSWEGCKKHNQLMAEMDLELKSPYPQPLCWIQNAAYPRAIIMGDRSQHWAFAIFLHRLALFCNFGFSLFGTFSAGVSASSGKSDVTENFGWSNFSWLVDSSPGSCGTSNTAASMPCLST